MKKATRPLIVVGAIAALGFSALASVGVAEAVSGTAHGNMSNIVDKIASTFNLDKAKVQQVFDEQRAEHKQHHKEMVTERLQQLVDNRAIRSEQKTAIEAKLTELRKQREADRDSLKDLSHEQRQEKMQQRRDELEKWANGQGLDLSKLTGIFKGHGFHDRENYMMP